MVRTSSAFGETHSGVPSSFRGGDDPLEVIAPEVIVQEAKASLLSNESDQDTIAKAMVTLHEKSVNPIVKLAMEYQNSINLIDKVREMLENATTVRGDDGQLHRSVPGCDSILGQIVDTSQHRTQLMDTFEGFVDCGLGSKSDYMRLPGRENPVDVLYKLADGRKIDMVIKPFKSAFTYGCVIDVSRPPFRARFISFFCVNEQAAKVFAAQRALGYFHDRGTPLSDLDLSDVDSSIPIEAMDDMVLVPLV